MKNLSFQLRQLFVCLIIASFHATRDREFRYGKDMSAESDLDNAEELDDSRGMLKEDSRIKMAG